MGDIGKQTAARTLVTEHEDVTLARAKGHGGGQLSVKVIDPRSGEHRSQASGGPFHERLLTRNKNGMWPSSQQAPQVSVTGVRAFDERARDVDEGRDVHDRAYDGVDLGLRQAVALAPENGSILGDEVTRDEAENRASQNRVEQPRWRRHVCELGSDIGKPSAAGSIGRCSCNSEPAPGKRTSYGRQAVGSDAAPIEALVWGSLPPRPACPPLGAAFFWRYR